MAMNKFIVFSLIDQKLFKMCNDISMVSCQKDDTRHAHAWQIGPFWQDTLDLGRCHGTFRVNIFVNITSAY